MFSKSLTKALSLLLVLVMLLSFVPAAYATDIESEVLDAPAIGTEVVEDLSEPSKELPDAPSEEIESELSESTLPEGPSETSPETEEEGEAKSEAIEDKDAVELPCGFVGMPKGYVLSDAELVAKVELVAEGTIEALATGAAHEEGIVIFSCEDETYAQMVADAYSALLVDCSYGVATIHLQTATVLEAVTAAADMELPLPAVWPNYISTIAPISSNVNFVNRGFAVYGLPQRQSWQTWVFENLPNPDPFISDPQGLPFQWHHDIINTYEAWGVTTGSSDIKVAIIDSGISAHEDIANVQPIDIGLGTDDDVGHGTHIAGIIGASLGNGLGGAGVSPGVTILSIKAGSSGISTASLIKGIRAAVDNGANIINLSLGSPFPHLAERTEIARALDKGVTILAATGNDGSNCISYPAAYDGVIGVAASDSTGDRAYFSNYGEWTDVFAPGADIYSTVPDPGAPVSNNYEYYDGTSMACPVAAGVCALYMSAVGKVSPATMEKVLESTCTNKIVDAAKMFDKTIDIPTLGFWNKNLTSYVNATAGQTIHCDSWLDFFSNIVDENRTVIYTINGKTPSVKNGEVVNGLPYNGPISLKEYENQTITVKVAAITGMGNISKVVTMKFKVFGDSTPSTKPSIKKPLVETITISGYTTIAPGGSATYKATVSPSNAGNKKVEWQLSGAPTGTTISSKGFVKVPADAPVGTAFEVWAISTDGSDVLGWQAVTVAPKCTAVTLNYDGDNITTNFKGVITAINLFNTPLYAGDDNRNEARLFAYTSGNVYADIEWSSSNKKVATVDANGLVTAVGKGSTIITAKALDGSNKKATIKINVTIPVSQISIQTNALRMTNDIPVIAFGKSVKNKATFGTTYGTPSNKEVTWDFAVYWVNEDGDVEYDITDTIKKDKLVSISGGTLKTSAKLLNLWHTLPYANEFIIEITATAQDGSGVYGSIRYFAIPGATKIQSLEKTYDISVDYSDTWLLKIYCDQYNFMDNSYMRYFTATSSKPSVCSVYDIYPVSGSPNYYWVEVSGSSKGSAKITVKTADGTNKSCSFTVKVG